MSHNEAITAVVDAWRSIAGRNPIAANFVRILDGLPEQLRFDAFTSLFESIPKTNRHAAELASVTASEVQRQLPELAAYLRGTLTHHAAHLDDDEEPEPLGEDPPIDPLDFLNPPPHTKNGDTP